MRMLVRIFVLEELVEFWKVEVEKEVGLDKLEKFKEVVWEGGVGGIFERR